MPSIGNFTLPDGGQSTTHLNQGLAYAMLGILLFFSCCGTLYRICGLRNRSTSSRQSPELTPLLDAGITHAPKTAHSPNLSSENIQKHKR